MNKHQTLESIYQGICIPMVCTYSSDIFQSHSAATKQYLDDFMKECRSLKSIFDEGSKKVTTNIDVILMLLPVPSKDELIKELHKRLRSMQSI